MLEKSCYEFLNALASKEPVPGGGGACAYVASLGAALGSMVGNLTLGKKKYDQVQEDIREMLLKSQTLMERLNGLVQEDAEAFLPLAKAYGMPAETEEQKAKKEETLQAALERAARVPLEIARVCVEAISLHGEYAAKGSRLAVSDAGCGAAFCRAALLGARLNVLINLNLMKDQALRDRLRAELDALTEKGVTMADEIFAKVEEELA